MRQILVGPIPIQWEMPLVAGNTPCCLRLCDLMFAEGAGLPVPKHPSIHEGDSGMEEFTRALADFVRDHSAWAAPIVLLLAFGESLAFISLLIPAWGALVAIGALIGASGISFWPVWIAGGIGAALGDWVSYWFGFKYKEKVAQMWPLSRYPEILPRGEAFVKNWGVPSIFIGRFFGPLRASVPLVAGIFEMSYWQFQIANFVSALVWSAALLLSGDVIAQIAEWLWRTV
jgi:membrane protein DedA with SNARE-associated domain